MSEHDLQTVERHCDVAIVGGSAAGLAAALQLVRQSRSVIVVDAGEPRHAPAAHRSGHLSRDGAPPSELTAAGREEVRSYGGEILAGRVGRVSRIDGDRFRVELVGGHSVVARRVLAATGLSDELPDGDGHAAVGPRFEVRAEAFTPLGLQPVPHPSGLGDFVETDACDQTVVPGLFAAGNATDPTQQPLQAAANGSRVGAMISSSLADDDLRSASPPAANEADWDHRYGREQIWSGNPNGTLVNEIRAMTPGRALDVGAGEGGDALWLAEQGWHVTANDISSRALDRIDTEAERRGLHIERHHADANAPDAFETAAFDLVSAQYAAIPRTPDNRGVRNLINAVAPGGTLLIVGHDLHATGAPADASTHNRPFDPDAYLQPGDFAAALTDSSTWDIEVNDKRPRPAGATSASHHISDVVLRARHRAS